MQINRDDLRRHYHDLSDEELLAVERPELTPLAQSVYDEEITRRNLTRDKRQVIASQPQLDPAEEAIVEEYAPVEPGEEPEWLPEAACACAFTSYPGNDTSGEAEQARAALEDAGIPCYLAINELPETDGPKPAYEYSVMVPGGLSLHATSIIDQAIFNPRLEDEWRTHFETLSDDELRALDPEIICAGLQDRINRLETVYQDEVTRRAGRE